VTVRRKARRFGIWVNTDAIEVDAAPTFYAVATTAPIDTVLTRDRGPAPPRLDPARDPRRGHRGGRPGRFIDALIRIRTPAISTS
jgi:hypothetical protein